MTYAEKLKDPRWQKKRLEILQRDGFQCQRCQCLEKTLHVHHSYYEPGLSPWEYESQTLITLCLNCHKFEQEYTAVAHRVLGKNPNLIFKIATLSSSSSEEHIASTIAGLLDSMWWSLNNPPKL